MAPYRSAAPTPATLGLRFLAGVVDLLLLNVVSTFVLLLTGTSPMDFVSLASRSPRDALTLIVLSFVGSISYFALLEGRLGASVGKAICKLRVVRADRNPPGYWRAALRAAIYVLLPVLPYWCAYAGDPKAYFNGPPAIQYVMSFSYYVVLALLVCGARRRNGFAAVQDLITKTRVVSRAAVESRPVIALSEAPPATVAAQPMLGPYHVMNSLGESAGVEWLLGYDMRLLRKVWLRVVLPGTPATPASLRNIGRIGRLRWLTGERSQDRNWDAYEALNGKPLLELIKTRQPWEKVRYWVYDLATELNAAEKDNTMPDALGLENVWITADGRAKLLDFPSPGLTNDKSLNPVPSIERGAHVVTRPTTPDSCETDLEARSATSGATQEFLNQVSAAALEGRAIAKSEAGEVKVPLPLHAREFLKRLPQFADLAALLTALKPLLTRVAEVSHLRRAIVVAACVAFPVLWCFLMLFSTLMLERWGQSHPGLLELNTLLDVRDRLRSHGIKMNQSVSADSSEVGTGEEDRPPPTDRQFAIYIAQHYAAAVTNAAQWTDVFALSFVKGDHRRFAEQSLLLNPPPTEEEISETEAAMKWVGPLSKGFEFMKRPLFYLGGLIGGLAVCVAFPALIAALLFRGGLVLLVTGVTFVRRDGARASRLRVFWRGLVAWGWLGLAVLVTWILLCAVYGVMPTLDQRVGTLIWALASALLIGGLTILSLALPKRGLPDRLAGTWPVLR